MPHSCVQDITRLPSVVAMSEIISRSCWISSFLIPCHVLGASSSTSGRLSLEGRGSVWSASLVVRETPCVCNALYTASSSERFGLCGVGRIAGATKNGEWGVPNASMCAPIDAVSVW